MRYGQDSGTIYATGNKGDTMRLIVRNLLGTLPLMLALTVLLAWAGREADLHQSECRTQWCTDRAAYEQAAQRDLIVEQLNARPDCTNTPHLSKTVLVTKAKGRIGDDLSVVHEMPLDQAWAQAKAGRITVLRWCK